MSKSILYSDWSNSVQKTARKNSNYSTNETMLKIGHLAKPIAFAWAIAFAKYSILGQKFKFSKTCQNGVYIHIRAVLCKKQLEKAPNILEIRRCEKSGILESLYMAYSLCQILNLGQKFKFLKTCQNRFCIHIGVILCKKITRKNTKHSRNKMMLEIGQLVKTWARAFGKFSIWVQNLNSLKHVKIDSEFTLE